jgi:hypothetical protein
MNGQPSGTAPTNDTWNSTHWLSYYSQCCGFLLALGQKFISLLTQASVFTTAVCAALIALRSSQPPAFVYIAVAVIACLPLLGFWHFIVRYRKQIEETGTLVRELEQNHFGHLTDGLRLLCRLRKKAPIYGLTPTTLLAKAYPAVLMLVVLVLGGLLTYLSPGKENSVSPSQPTGISSATPTPTPIASIRPTPQPPPAPPPNYVPPTGTTFGPFDRDPIPAVINWISCPCDRGADRCELCRSKKTRRGLH